jgi:hypothetical protein
MKTNSAKEVPKKKTTPRKKKITDGDIRKRAKEIYEARLSQGIPGSADDDWAQAEQELKQK